MQELATVPIICKYKIKKEMKTQFIKYNSEAKMERLEDRHLYNNCYVGAYGTQISNIV